MKIIIIISMVFSNLIAYASSRYECETPLVSNRIVHAQGSLNFTDDITNNGRRILTDIIAEIRVDWDPLPTDECSSEYCGEFQIDRLEEYVNYKPRIYKNYSKFINFTAQSSRSGRGGDLIVEKKTGEKKMRAHYIFQAGDHIGGVIDFDCTKVD